MKITRIKPPKFRVGRYVLNEYEIRQYCYEVACGDRPSGDIIIDRNGKHAIIQPNGRLNTHLAGWDVGSEISLKHMRLLRQQEKDD